MVTIREMLAEDVPAVSEIVSLGYKFLSGEEGFTQEQIDNLLTHCASEEKIQKWLTKYASFVAEMSGCVVGVIGIEKNDIGELWILPQHHHQGVGTSLFKRAEAYMVKEGHKKLLVNTTGYATPFYEAMGARVVGRKQCSNGPLMGSWMLTYLEKPLVK